MSFVGCQDSGHPLKRAAIKSWRVFFWPYHPEKHFTVLNSVEFIRSEHSLFSCAIGAIFSLHWWTLHRTVGAKDAAVARLGAQHCLAADAFVENLASASCHRLALSEAADRALQHRRRRRVQR